MLVIFLHIVKTQVSKNLVITLVNFRLSAIQISGLNLPCMQILPLEHWRQKNTFFVKLFPAVFQKSASHFLTWKQTHQRHLLGRQKIQLGDWVG